MSLDKLAESVIKKGTTRDIHHCERMRQTIRGYYARGYVKDIKSEIQRPIHTHNLFKDNYFRLLPAERERTKRNGMMLLKEYSFN